MQIELDDYEAQRIKFLVQAEMSTLKSSVESMLYKESTKEILQQDYEMFENILNKLSA